MEGASIIMKASESVRRFFLVFVFSAPFFASGALAEPKKEPRVIYPEKTELDFEGAAIEGELRNPGELYFQRRQEEKFGSLVQPRRQFRRAMLRDVMQTR
ncbi:MAG: hypothetical protein RJB38_1476 [Pseudomonadota bacterium]|jgi:hypothetical protein